MNPESPVTSEADLLFVAPPQGRLEFGPGAVQRLPAAVSESGASRAFVVSDTGLAACGVLPDVVGILTDGDIDVGVSDTVMSNPTTDTLDDVAAHVRAFCGRREAAPDLPVVVAVGGGAVIDVAKGVALLAADGLRADQAASGLQPARPGLPVVAVPTTAGTGSETNGFGVVGDTRAGCKVYVGDVSVQPRVCVLDPQLTVGLPLMPTAASGYDAFVHAVESLASKRSTPLSAAYARQGLRLVTRWLPAALADGTDLDARSHMLLGAHLAGRALTLSGLGLVHGVAHALSARYGTPHGPGLAAVCATVLAYNAQTCPRPYADAALELGLGRSGWTEAAQAAAFVEFAGRLAADCGLPTSLEDVGARTEDDVPALAAVALNDPVAANNPRRPDASELGLLLATNEAEAGPTVSASMW